MANKSPLTDSQRTWIIEYFNYYTPHKMELLMNVDKKIIKNLVDTLLKSGKIKRTHKHHRSENNTIMAKKPEGAKDRRELTSGGDKEHSQRKPPVSLKSMRRDDKLPNRVIDITGKIKVVMNDKNHTTFWAVDEDHVVRIRKTYAYLEKPLEARL